MKIATESGYTVEFPDGLEARPQTTMQSPFRGETVAIPFVIRGVPGLVDVRFTIRSVEDKNLDYYRETFSSVLRPGGFWTNFIGRRRHELRGELTVPRRLFPIEVAEVKVTNLSERFTAPRAGSNP
jgi:hypothetical protein